MMVTIKNKSGTFRSKKEFHLIRLIIKEKPRLIAMCLRAFFAKHLLIKVGWLCWKEPRSVLAVTLPFYCKYADWLLFPLEKNRSKRLDSDVTWQPFIGVLIDQNGLIYNLGMIFNA